MDGDFTWPERHFVDVENLTRDAFFRTDKIHDDIMNAERGAAGADYNMDGEDEYDEANLENLVRDSMTIVFDGSSLNRLQCGIVLFSLCSLYSVPHTFVDALLMWIAGDLLPTSNCFPRTSYELRSMLMKVGLKHKQVHCCPDGHVLYEGKNEDLEECPSCLHPRYFDGSNKVPQ